jgi:hypothetical protein
VDLGIGQTVLQCGERDDRSWASRHQLLRGRARWSRHRCRGRRQSRGQQFVHRDRTLRAKEGTGGEHAALVQFRQSKWNSRRRHMSGSRLATGQHSELSKTDRDGALGHHNPGRRTLSVRRAPPTLPGTILADGSHLWVTEWDPLVQERSSSDDASIGSEVQSLTHGGAGEHLWEVQNSGSRWTTAPYRRFGSRARPATRSRSWHEPEGSAMRAETHLSRWVRWGRAQHVSPHRETS